jgi:transcriptional regulator with XRE-family HTH domain
MAKTKSIKRVKSAKSARATKELSIIRRTSERTPSITVLPKTARNQEFGKRLRDLMQKKGVQQYEVADALNIGRDSMSGYARGRIMPLKDRLEDIAKFLQVDPTELVPHFGMDVSNNEIAPHFDLKIGEDGTAWLAINQRLPADLALEIAALVRKSKKNGS